MFWFFFSAAVFVPGRGDLTSAGCTHHSPLAVFALAMPQPG